MRLKFIMLSALMWAAQTFSAPIDAEGWRIGEIPIGNVGERIIDPDNLLTPEESKALNGKISTFEAVNSVSVSGDEFPVQIAFAIVQRMNMDAFQQYDDDREDVAAEAFAVDLHNKLGVGHQTTEGGTGALIFLSAYDRVMFVSRGGAVQSHLNNYRIDRMIHDLRHLLKGAKYGDALSSSVDKIAEYIQRGKPGWKETLYEAFVSLFPFLAFLSVILSIIFINERHVRAQQRQYAQVESQLSEMDRARAEALQGQYQATSCPICLEDFISETTGSDEQPIKLLRCGHVFDETCWAEWVSSGRGNVAQCPICKMDVGRTEAVERSQGVRANETDQVRARNQERNEEEQNSNQLVNNIVEENDVIAQRPGPDRALRQYIRERNFRLARLATRYPQYVGQQQIQRWSNPNYSGSLAQDSQFRQSNPMEQRQARAGNNYGGSNRSFASFGGGSSSGGRGGRW